MGIDNVEIKKQLHSLAEPEFQRFSSRLIPNIPPKWMLGVRLSHLRSIAKGIGKEDWKGYLRNACDDTFEEVMLQGMVIGYSGGTPEEVFAAILDFLPKVNNWSVCDSFCSGLKIAREYPEEMWDFLQPLLQEERPYFVRFAVVMTAFYYVDDLHTQILLGLLDNIHHEEYYVKMAVAWAISLCYIKYPLQTAAYLENCSLDDDTYNKSLQKVIESRQIDEETKALLRRKKRRAVEKAGD